MNNILLVDDERELLTILSRILKKEGYNVLVSYNGKEAIEMLDNNDILVIVTDIKMPDMSGLELLDYIKEKFPDIPVIVTSAYGDIDTAIDAIKRGAFWYLSKPFNNKELKLLIKNAIEKEILKQESRRLREELSLYSGYGELIGISRPMQIIYDIIRKVAPTDSSVLIEGESGTGKELVARTIQQNSPRRNAPFITINCGSLPENLLESELFGYKKGAFTGAIQDKIGLFEAANKGTIFLDEISETSPSLQVKLLRVIQFKEIIRIGDVKPRKIDVRIISATNRNLEEYVRCGKFRSDLFYRLNIVNIKLPPLRERIDDIPMLAEYFLKRITSLMKKGHNIRFTDEAIQALQAYSWPGNVRELENIIERAVILGQGNTITEDLIKKMLPQGHSSIIGIPKTYEEFKQKKRELISRLEYDFALNAIKDSHGNISRAARKVGIDRSNFSKLLVKYNIDPDEYRK